ncbi:D-alanyl-D-alanine carboxypeptidase family protein [Serpentinicella alkaliphila]|uniref:serine-type D-Ala-D-Ala carboxypeptidase n=1 Tax=Serpentinicella alkaliphila TaxID=1734049 RepID=A0A4R2UCI1_9FIRM|nr:D-alanyl-D-alanine carboxypeptidase family protein [Serpentinicella alkaliphila]QUH26749.1 D-alanyl-D-alanine carboxypeptidase [Serpentinicella alkaliphila]TCQ07969.1 D-alanyl-D-alanine carboxypeptidase (penicillin-binding protein 5/6) [Serpentinicella alkaliphila]
MKKHIYSFILITILLLVNMSGAYAQPLDISSPNAVLMDYTTGKVIFDHNAHVPAYPASTTKVLTALLALENLDLNEVLTVDYDIYVIGSSMYLMKGESFTVEELIQALMIRSANDAAELLAIRISGSVEEFTNLMNKRAKELGALNSNFTNPHGLPDDNHITTAYDLAMITKQALKFDKFREIMSTVNLQFEPTEQTPETRYFRNSNRFLWATGRSNQILYNGRYVDIKYDIIDGVKTGYTPQARNCLISSSLKDGHRLIAVVLGSGGGEVYSDSRKLIDYGYDNFKLVNLIKGNNGYTDISITNSKANTTTLYTASDLHAILPKDFNESLLTTRIETKKDIKAPINEGSVLGNLDFIYNSEVVGTVNLINLDEVQSKSFIVKLLSLKSIFRILSTIFVLWQGLVIYLRLSKQKIRKFGTKRYGNSYKFSRNLFK